jgi:uncharacterized protein YkwD
MSRVEANQLFQQVYLASEGVPSGWTGNVGLGDPGTLSPAFLEAVRVRVNYFRQMAGLTGPPIQLDATLNAKAQQAALLMSANGALSHFPPPTWKFWTQDGAEAAGSSNLYLGFGSPDAIDGFIRDPGPSNSPVGHRRWILYPPTTVMGVGIVPEGAPGSPWASTVLWVIDRSGFSTPPSPDAPQVAWPPAGYVPEPFVTERWSLSNITGGVTMTRNGHAVPVTVVSTGGSFGEPTLVWEPDRATLAALAAADPPASDVTYQVTVTDPATGQVVRYTTVTFDPMPVWAVFAAPAAEVAEPRGGPNDPPETPLEVRIVRTGDPRFPARARVTTRDGTAAGAPPGANPGGADFTQTDQVITFAAGESERTITVGIRPDRLVEGPETFTLELRSESDPGGALLATMAVTIRETATPGEGKPPVARKDAGRARRGQDQEFAVLANDFDPEGGPLRIVGASARGAEVTVTPAGTLRVRVPDRFRRSALVVTYQIEDVAGLRATGRLRLKVPAARPVRRRR